MFKLKEFVTFILISAFLVTSFGSMFGCVCCDSGSLSDTHITNHLDNHNSKSVAPHVESPVDVHAIVNINGYKASLDQHYRKTGDFCVDSAIEFSSGIVEETESVKGFVDIDIDSPSYDFFKLECAGLVVNNLTLKSPPGISQTILFHRTVVLLS